MAVVSIVCATGCGRPAGELFPPLPQTLHWPPPPETPRVAYVGELTRDSDLAPARSFGESLGEAVFGENPDRSMLTPYALCTDDDSRLFVCDSTGQMIHVFDLETREYSRWKPPEDVAALSQPIGIAFDGLGRLLVTDSLAGVIHAFDAEGAYLGDLGGDHLLRPCGLAIEPNTNRLFVADSAAHQIVILAVDGEQVGRIGRRGVALGEFNFPTNVAFDRMGRLYVGDSLNFRVQVFDDRLEPLRQIGEHGDMPGYFSMPKGMAFDSDNHLYVVDAHFEAVQIFDADGTLLLAFGEEGSGPGQFWIPVGIHIDSNDRIWIADSYNRRIQVFDYLAEELQP